MLRAGADAGLQLHVPVYSERDLGFVAVRLEPKLFLNLNASVGVQVGQGWIALAVANVGDLTSNGPVAKPFLHSLGMAGGFRVIDLLQFHAALSLLFTDGSAAEVVTVHFGITVDYAHSE
jgi:hypothetical protein